MFVATFTQMNSEKIDADTNGNKPYIGDVVAGKSRGSFINGTIFQNEGLEPKSLYLCDNVDEEYTNPAGVTSNQVRVQVIAKVSVLEFMQLKKELGAGKLEIAEKTEADKTVDAPVNFEG